jgi:pimeloyl-ACP methyl ester carboxylesterase
LNTQASADSAAGAPNRFVEVGGRRLAYRSIGSGKPIVLCTRFRGNLVDWDPAFLDALAAHGFQVITFDYSGLGLSTGERTYNPMLLAKDATDLIESLALRDIVIGGWSLGGITAQIVAATLPRRISHAVLIATSPPGELVKTAEQLFHDVATKPVNDFDDSVVLFFEPRSDASREAARRSAERIAQRSADRSVPVPGDWAAAALGNKPRNPVFPAPTILEAFKSTTMPILHIGGDHDIVFPVENWYALNGQLPTLQLLTFPRAGHGPHHQHPQASADHIGIFVRTTGETDA